MFAERRGFADPVALAGIILESSPNAFKAAEKPQMLLHDILNFMQLWHVKMFEWPLFEEEFEYWLYGAVLPSVWHEYRDPDRPLTMLRLGPHRAGTLDEMVRSVFVHLTQDQFMLICDVLQKYDTENSLISHAHAFGPKQSDTLQTRWSRRTSETSGRIRRKGVISTLFANISETQVGSDLKSII